MGVVTTQVTVRGTDYPWEIGASTPNTDGTALVAYNTHFCDGSATLLATAGQNAAYLYGQLHQHAGETSPTKVAVTSGDKILIQYLSTFVQTQGTSAGDSGPGGSPVSSGTAPLPAGGCVNSSMPSNVITGVNNFTGTGTVNTAGTAVTLVTGTFNPNAMIGHFIWINSVKYSVSSATPTTLVLGATAGTQTGVTWYFWGAETAIGGLIGAITDSSNNVLSVWDFGSWVGNLSFAISGASETSASVVTMSGSYSGTQFYNPGQPVFITGISGGFLWLNGHTHYVISSTSSQLVIQDSTNHGTQSILSLTPGNALGGQITLTAPANAAFMTMGINDTQLFDNTGSFVVNVSVTTGSSTSTGNPTAGPSPFKHFPGGIVSCSFPPDQFPGMSATVFCACYPVWQMEGSPLNRPMVGQLWPRGAQNTGGNVPGVGQNFPY